MMSAVEYRARAAALVGEADLSGDYELILRLELTAQAWRQLAEMADWQDIYLAAMGSRGAIGGSAEPGDP